MKLEILYCHFWITVEQMSIPFVHPSAFLSLIAGGGFSQISSTVTELRPKYRSQGTHQIGNWHYPGNMGCHTGFVGNWLKSSHGAFKIGHQWDRDPLLWWCLQLTCQSWWRNIANSWELKTTKHTKRLHRSDMDEADSEVPVKDLQPQIFSHPWLQAGNSDKENEQIQTLQVYTV